LGTSGFTKPAGIDQKLKQGTAQVSDLQARYTDHVREHDRPNPCTLGEPESGSYKKAKQDHGKQCKYSESEPKRGPDTQHNQGDDLHFETLHRQVGRRGLNSL
jgi:hypothetical protein